MKNEFVPYDIALAMKELGFDMFTFGLYYYKTKELKIVDSEGINLGVHIAAPLYQQAFRWLREEYGIVHTIYKVKDDYVFGLDVIGSFHNNSTYQEAQDACLRKLIEIVKEK